MSNAVVYVRTPSTYGMDLAAKHLTPNKIYKATKANNRTDSQLYNIVDDLAETRDILLTGCMWLLGRDWEITTEEEYIYQELTMNNDTKIKRLTRAECLREHARVIEMCEGTDISVVECIRLRGVQSRTDMILFTGDNTEYTFAIRIHEGKPVFEGDTLYLIEEVKWIPSECFAKPSWTERDWECVSWIKPEIKKTCNLNGTELPLADGNNFDYPLLLSEIKYKNIEDRNKVSAAIVKLLKGEVL